VLTADGRLLFVTRFLRLFAYGSLSIVLVLYLEEIGLSETEIGFLLMLVLLGDTVLSLWITTAADRVGRRRMLVVGALLMLAAGIVFALASNFWLLVVAGTIGVISPADKEVGPFLAVEHAALSQIVPNERRTSVFAWHNLTASIAAALGSLAGGVTMNYLVAHDYRGAEAYRPVVFGYAAIGFILALLFTRLSPAAEADAPPPSGSRFGLHRSRGVVFRLSSLFALDAFGGGFLIQGLLSYWFKTQFGTNWDTLGVVFAAANLLAAFSALAATWIAKRIGLINTMVFTHLPSNVLLILVPLMPTEGLAIAVLLLRFSISQMDVPTRQSYTVAVVSPDERSAAAGWTSIARSVGAAISPAIATKLMSIASLAGVPFFLAGGFKILYDLLLYRSFSKRDEMA
jgi:MFS family permease